MRKRLLALFLLIALAFTATVPYATSTVEAVNNKPPKVKVHPKKKNPPNVTPGAGDWGYYLLNTGGNVTGIKGRLSVFKTGFILSAQSPDRDQIYYAPTLMPPNNSCLELTVAHFRYAGTSPTQHGIGFWDWCADGAGGDGVGGWQNYFNFTDTNFWNTYTYQGYANGERFIDFLVTKGGGCSYGYFLVRSTGIWDLKSTACGTNPYNDIEGWTMFEIYGATENPNPVCFGPLGPQNSVRTEYMMYYPYTSYITGSDYGNYIRPTGIPPWPCWTLWTNNYRYGWSDLPSGSWQVQRFVWPSNTPG